MFSQTHLTMLKKGNHYLTDVVFGYLILVSIDFDNFISVFSLVSVLMESFKCLSVLLYVDSLTLRNMILSEFSFIYY